MPAAVLAVSCRSGLCSANTTYFVRYNQATNVAWFLNRGDHGYRVLPAAVYLEHVEKLRDYSRKFTAAVEEFAAQFDVLVIKSRSRLGGLFRPEDYPTSEEIRHKFGFETKVMPLPDADDFRVSLGDEEKDRIKRQIAESVEASLTVASRELWQRMYESVSHMAERLSAYKTTE